jgi:hypothetical protein
MGEEQVFAVFMAIWISLGIAVALFYWKAAVATKRKWHPWLLIGSGALFVGFAYAMVRQAFMLLFMLPAVVLIQFLNYMLTKFCSRCGATLIQSPPWTRMHFCQKCGAALDT